MIRATDRVPVPTTEYRKNALLDRRTLYESVLVFAVAGLVIFLFSSRMVGIFDEGILLTDVLCTMSGQVLHRDFYYNYGPAQLYMLAGLFKLFGPSVFVDRFAALLSNAFAAVHLRLVRQLRACSGWSD